MKLLALFLLTAFAASADVVVSIRYFKSEGTSHWHLYLFRDDGTPIRQLTSPQDAHDLDPRFSDDGRFINFTRKKGNVRQAWRIGKNGSGLRPFDGSPLRAKYPDFYSTDESGKNGEKARRRWEPRGDGFRMTIPGSRNELLLPKGDIQEFEDSGAELRTLHFRALTMRDYESDNEKRFELFEESPFSCNFLTIKGDPFLRRDGFMVVFFYRETGSSGGYRVGAVDLLGKRVIRITEENPAVIYPHGTRSGFFSHCEERYQPLPETDMTVNCTYLDWWDKDFKRTRFASRLSLFGGASVRLKWHPPLDIPGGR